MVNMLRFKNMTALHTNRVPCPMNECWRCQKVAVARHFSSQMVVVPWKEGDAKKWVLAAIMASATKITPAHCTPAAHDALRIGS